jgi:peptide/nickel transport system substrate-binding protein
MSRSETSPSIRVRRRVALGLIASTAVASLLAACSAPAPANNPTPPAAPATPAPAGAAARSTTVSAPATGGAQPKSGGTLQLGMIQDVTTLDAHNSTPNQYDTTWSVFDRLIQYDVDMTPQPALAESWEVSSDLKQVKLNLRRGVQWHSGREFTSDDVKYNMLRVRDPKLAKPALASQSNWFTGIDMPDKYTVVLTSELPRPLIYDFFEYLNLTDRETAEGPDAKTKAVGTGAFKFVEWVQGDHLTFAKNPNYWRPGVPYVDSFVAHAIPNGQSMLAQFEAGAVDVVKAPAQADFARYKSDPNYQTISHPVSGNHYEIGINVTQPPLDNKKVRQALSYAINRKYLADTIMKGVGTAESLPWPASNVGFEASKQNFFTFDLDKAKSLLKEAGVGNLELEMNVPNNYAELVSFAQVYQADLAKIGIQLKTRVLDALTNTNQMLDGSYGGLYISNDAFAHLEPVSALLSGRSTDPNSNISRFDNADYKKLIADASVETDVSKRKALYSQLNDFLLDQCFMITICSNPTLLAFTQKVHGIEPSLHEGFYYYNAWLG